MKPMELNKFGLEYRKLSGNPNMCSIDALPVLSEPGIPIAFLIENPATIINNNKIKKIGEPIVKALSELFLICIPPLS